MMGFIISINIININDEYGFFCLLEGVHTRMKIYKRETIVRYNVYFCLFNC